MINTYLDLHVTTQTFPIDFQSIHFTFIKVQSNNRI